MAKYGLSQNWHFPLQTGVLTLSYAYSRPDDQSRPWGVHDKID